MTARRVRSLLRPAALLAAAFAAAPLGSASAADCRPRGDLVRTPTIQVEVGHHTDAILDGDVDARGEILVTSGADRTIRVWSLESGAQERVFHLPVGDIAVPEGPDGGGGAGEGLAYDVALSPDGRWIAASGPDLGTTWLGPDQAGNCVYLLDRDHGRLEQALFVPRGASAVEFTDADFEPAGGLPALAIADGDGVVALYRLAGDDEAAEGGRLRPGPALPAPRPRRPGPATALRAEGPVLFLLTGSGALRLWDGEERLHWPLGGIVPVGFAAEPLEFRMMLTFRDSATVLYVDMPVEEAADREAPGGGGEPAISVVAFGMESPPDRPLRLDALAWSPKTEEFLVAGRTSPSERGTVWVVDASEPKAIPPDQLGAFEGVPRMGSAALTTFPVTPVRVARSDIRRLFMLDDGRLVYLSEEPAWGIADPTGAREPLVLRSPVPVVRDAAVRVTASPDARSIAVDFGDGRVLSASLEGRRPVRWADSAPSEAIPARTRTADGRALGVARSRTPRQLREGVERWGFTLGEEPVAEELRQVGVRAVPRTVAALSGDDALAAIAMQGGIAFRAANAGPLAAPPFPTIATPAEVLSLHLNHDGSLAAALLGDGTLRWYVPGRGELVAVLALARGESDLRRAEYVAWTPSGDYTASVGAEEAIGWRVDRPDPYAGADLYPAYLFRERHYRADFSRLLLDRLTGGWGARAAVPDPLPPVLRLDRRAVPAIDGSTVALRGDVHQDRGAPIDGWRAMADGRVLDPAGIELLVSGTRFEARLAVPEGTGRVDLLASSGGVFGPPAHVGRAEAGAGPGTRGMDDSLAGFLEEQDGTLRILAVGVSDYRHDAGALGDLRFAAKDAEELVAALGAGAKRLHGRVEVRLLRDGEATKGAILDGLSWLEGSSAKDSSVIFLAGHGTTDGDRYRFLPHDADDRDPTTLIRGAELSAALARVPGLRLLILDSCRAGAAPSLDGFVNGMRDPRVGVVTLAASTGDQPAEEGLYGSRGGNGAFTYSMLDGVRGRAGADDAGRVSLLRLAAFVSERVRALTDERQTPVIAIPTAITDFPVVEVAP